MHTTRSLEHLADDVYFQPRQLETINLGPVQIPDPNRLVHLQLRRFAGCPICSLHLRSFARRHEELVAARVVEVAVFHSSIEDLRKVHLNQPFAIVPDPEKQLYTELGVGTSASAMLDPSVWVAAGRALRAGASADPSAGSGDGSFGLPGDFLIDPDGRIVAAYRGVHADDQWSVDELLQIVALYRGAK
jgi:peroxiredoxin